MKIYKNLSSLIRPAGREAAAALEAGLLQRRGAAASPASGFMAAARGTFVAVVDLVAAAAAAADGVPLLSRQNCKFDVLQLAWDDAAGRRLAVAGLRTVQVLMKFICSCDFLGAIIRPGMARGRCRCCSAAAML